VTSLPTSTSTVLVVLVAHDGVAWLPRTLDALAAQTHPAIEVLAVDNASSDGSRELLLDRLGEERVLLADRDLGLPSAVSMALDANAAASAPYVLLLHDDLALAPDAVEHLVRALDDDPRLAVVGPKLRAWDRPGQLQSVGFTIDLTGRADNGVDDHELDQGQRDQQRRPLYVSTAGMMVRREVFDALGRLDRRYHVFRDDLDLCWRVWLAGHDVEVVPEAVGEHVGGTANYLRLGQTRFLGPRYFAERNTLATLIKNHGRLRLLAVLPAFVLVGLAKIAGFLLTRRFADAYQTLRAWAWNLLHARESLRYRRRVQAARRRTDAEIAQLFGKVGPRVRAYAEAMASWVAGGDVGAAPEPARSAAIAPARERSRPLERVRRRPTLVAGTGLLLLVLAASWQLLLPGELRGGELAPWPGTAAAFLGDYVAGWHEAGAFGTADAPSPAQALLGLLQLSVGGSDYLAPRVLLLAPLFVGWLLALRAAQTYSQRRVPRVVAATAYVLSPPTLAALQTGRVGALVAVAVLPGLVAGGITLARRHTPPARAWRAVAGVALLGAIGGAFEPLVLLAIVATGLLATIVGVIRAGDAAWRVALLARAGVAVAGPVVLLLPWSLEVLGPDGHLAGAATSVAGDELWRWLLLSPGLPGFPGLLAGVGFALAGLLGLAFGVRRSPGLVASLWVAALTGAVAAWWLDRTLATTWAGLPLLVTAAAFAGLFAVAFATGEASLSRHAFGWRHLAAVTTVGAVVVSIGAVAASLLTTSWDTYAVDDPALPSFLVVEAAEEGPFRVLVLADVGDEVVWEVVDGDGASMAAYGVPTPEPATRLIDDAVDDLLAVRDPGAVDRLAMLGIRYVLVPPGSASAELSEALLEQTGAEPRPVPEGQLLAVVDRLPRAAVIPPDVADEVAERGAPPEGAEIGALAPRGDGVYEGRVTEPSSSVLVSEVADDGWRVRGGAPAGTIDADSELLRVDDVPEGRVRIEHEGTAARGLAVTGQVLAVLLAISLALRPPSFARAHPREAASREATATAHGRPGGGDAPSHVPGTLDRGEGDTTVGAVAGGPRDEQVGT
jgi:GT2 family glycosyltransferase